jgi:peptide-methionine (S)-S-oxide reductase
MQRVSKRPGRGLVFASLGFAAAAFAVLLAPSSHAEAPRIVPPPAVDAARARTSETAILAGGCFWGVQAVFQHVDGVTSAVSGYAGGDRATAHYEMVSTGQTGHAEAVKVTFDPRKVSYGTLLRIFFSVAHDPTQLDRQGPDRGTQYRSAIFPADEEQARVAAAYVAQLDKGRVFGRPIVTRIEPRRAFFPAEEHHQDFLVRNPAYPYIVINDLPKVEALSQLYPDLYRTKPVLVLAAGQSN